LTDVDDNRLTCLATNIAAGVMAELELRHRSRARCEDRIGTARATGLRNLPLDGSHRTSSSWRSFRLPWTPRLALTGAARCWEVKTLRLRLFSTAGQLVTTDRRRRLRLAAPGSGPT
jgi:hypothetical protein